MHTSTMYPEQISQQLPEQVTAASHESENRTRSERTADLLRRVAGEDRPEVRRDLLERVVLLNMGVARSVARRYRSKGIASEDLDQVAYVALVRAADKFDPSLEKDFLTYAIPSIRGEIKKHFRDSGWVVRPPRRIQELQPQVVAAGQELTHSLGRSPRPSEVAAHIGVDVEEVIEALAMDGCFQPTSLDVPVGDGGSSVLGDLLEGADTGLRASEARMLLAPVLRQLGERDRRILYLRFFEGQTQREIGRELGVTQMQVSRLLTRICQTLRQQLAESADQNAAVA
jgi:RNA polymerase sigma-B factor